MAAFVNENIRSVQFQLTTICNERCIFCRKYTWPKKQIPIEVVAEKLEQYPNAALQFSGGEPTMYDHLVELIELIEGRPYKVYTNGVIDDSGCGIEAKKKFLDGAKEIAISFDADNMETYNSIRHPLDSYAFLKVLKTASLYSEKAKLSMVVTKNNVQTIPNIIAFANSKQIKTRFYPLHTNTAGLVVEEKQLESLKACLKDMDYDHCLTNVDQIFSPDYFVEKRKFIPCGARNVSRLIDEDGRKYPCCYAINDNGKDIDGKFAIEHPECMLDQYEAYEYCDHCTRYRRFNATGETSEFM